ncbi:MAG TPA: M1 family aminopeptidase [Candidatus Wallbacteria bacterium]|nr:M1 family aminopeptidase [Candidatus Wallbacteria bacterium]
MTESDKIIKNSSISKIMKKLFLAKIGFSSWVALCYFLCAACVLPGAEASVAFQPVKALNYKLSIFLYPEKHIISGEVEIKTSVSSSFTGEIILNLNRDMEARFVKLLPGGRNVKFAKTGDTLAFNAEGTFESVLVSFYGDPSIYITAKNSFTYIGKEGCYFDDLCYYFPRFGIEEKATFELSAAVPNEWLPVTQGNLISKAACSENGLYTVYNFKNDRPARCHTLAAGPYIEKKASEIQKPGSQASSGEVVLNAGFEVSAFFFNDDRSYANDYINEAIAILEFYKKNYGVIETGRLNIVEIEKLFPGGYGPEEVIYITAAAVNGGRTGAKITVDSELLSHEIAHQWFGNYVCAEFPKANFLNEAFATYASMQYLKARKYSAFSRYSEDILRRYQLYRIFSGTNEISIADACVLGRIPAYQEIVYYRGAFVLSLILEKISSVSKLSPSRIIEKYVEKYKNKTVAVEDFKAFALNVNKGLYDFTPEDADLKKIDAFFNDYYNGTAAIEISFKKAELVETIGEDSQAVCRVTLDRTDATTGEAEINVSLSGKDFIKKYPLNVAHGKKTYDIKCWSKPSFLSIDPDHEGLTMLPVPALEVMSHKDRPTVIYGSSSMNRKVNSFMREYAKTFSTSPFMDCAIGESDALGNPNVIIIGAPGNNSILKKIEGHLPFKYFKYSVSSSADRTFYDENYALAYVISNPFRENGTITVISFETDVAINYVSKLNRGISDYAIYLPSQNLLMTENFNQTGSYPVSVKKSGAENEGFDLKIASAAAGFENTVIDNKINSLFVNVQSDRSETISVSLRVSNSQTVLMKKKAVISPKTLTELEFSFFLKADYGKRLTVDLLDEKDAVVSSMAFQYKSVYSNYIYLMPLSDESSNSEMVVSTLGDIFAKHRNQFEVIRFNFNRLPSDAAALASISGIILNNFRFESSKSQRLKESLISYAMNGGKVIISGYDFSSDDSGIIDADFMEKIFAHKISASTNYNFGKDLSRAVANVQAPDNLNPVGFRNILKSSVFKSAPPVILHGQSLKTNAIDPKNSLRGRVERLFEGALARSVIGKGFFYYIPYDFTAPRVRKSELNEKIMTSVFITKSKWREPLIGWQRLAPGFVFKEGDNMTGLRIEFFIIFILAYIICLGPVLLSVLKEKFSTDDYFAGMGVVTLMFTFIIIAWGLSISRFFTSVDLVTITEIPTNYFGKITSNNFFRVAAGNVSEVELYIPETDILESNTPQQYKTRILLDGEPGDNRVKVKITNPMRFVANTFSFSESNLKIDAPEAISIEGLLETTELSIKISAPCIARLAEKGKFVSILRLPGGHRLFEPAGHAIDARIEYSKMISNLKISETLDSCGFLSDTDRDSISQIFKYIDENERYAATSVLMSVYHDAVSVSVGGSEKRMPRTRIILSPFSLSIKPGSVMPSQVIHKYERNYYSDKYTDFTVDLSDYKRNVSTGAYKGLTAVFKFKQSNGILPQGINQLQKQFVDSVHVSLGDLDLSVAQSQLTATVKNFNKYLNIDEADDYLTRFSIPVFKPPFNLLEAEASIICE